MKNVFALIKCEDVFNKNVPIINFKVFASCAHEQMMLRHNIRWKHSVAEKPKLHLYHIMKDNYITENFCQIGLNRAQPSLIAKLCIEILPINKCGNRQIQWN